MRSRRSRRRRGGEGGEGGEGRDGAESLKAAATAGTGGGTFWTSGEHFGPKFTLFCRICSFVANQARLTVFKSVKVS